MCEFLNPKEMWSTIKRNLVGYDDIEYGYIHYDSNEVLVRPNFPCQEDETIDILLDHRDFWKQHKIDAFLGEGTYGKVYMVKHNTSKEISVFKWIDHPDTTNPYDINREINILKNVPYKVDFLPKYIAAGLYEYNGTKHYGIEMEHIAGSDVEAFMKTNPMYLRAEHKFSMVIQMVNIVHYLHVKLGIVHRDLKVRNFMYNVTQNKLVLIDFGMAECYDEKHPYYDEKFTTDRVRAGTALYLPLEVLQKKDLTSMDYPGIDIWALGIVIYFLYYGIEPFGKVNVDTVPDLIKEIEKYSLDENNNLDLSHVLSTKIATILRNCLKCDKKERWNINQIMDYIYQ